MKKSLGLLMIVIAVIAMALVSCDASTAPKADAVGEVVLDSSQSRGISVTVDNTVNVENLYWYYRAEKNDNGLFNTGVTNGFIPVKKNTAGEATTGLRDANLGLFSYGNWTFTLRGVGTAITGNTIDEADILYSGSQTLDVNKDKNFLNLTLVEGAGLNTEIKFDTTDGIWFSHSRIKEQSSSSNAQQSFSLTAVDYVNGEEQCTITSENATVEAGKVSFKSMSYPEVDVVPGQHVMRFTLTQHDVAPNISTVATYELTYTVKKGYTHTIKGDLTSAEVQGEVAVGTYAKSVPATTATLVLPVDSSDSKTVVASENNPIVVSTMDLTVKYPGGVKLTNGTKTAGSGENVTADATIGFELQTTNTPNISITTSQAQTTYELILNVAQNNETLVEVSKFIGKNLEVEGVYHNSNELPSYGESYIYDAESGILTLYVKHASPIDIVTKKVPAVASIGDEKFTTLQAAIAASVSNDTIVLLESVEITTDKYNVDNRLFVNTDNLTIDLNGNTLTVPNFTLTLSGDDIIVKNGTIVATTTSSNQTYGSYVVVSNGKNTVFSDLTTIGGINISGYNQLDDSIIDEGISASIIDCEITATNYYAVCAQGESCATVRNTTLHAENGISFFWVEKEFTDQYGTVYDSGLLYEVNTVVLDGEKPIYNGSGLKPITAVYADTEAELKNALNNDFSVDLIILTNDINLTAPITISKSISLTSEESCKHSLKGYTVTASEGTIEFSNIIFDSPRNTNNKASNLYVTNDAEVTVDGCVFKDSQWDSIQVTSGVKKITINDCEFITSENATPRPQRYIHIQETTGTIVDGFYHYPDEEPVITITGNTFNNVSLLVQDFAEVDYIHPGNVTVGKNTVNDMGDNVGFNIYQKQNPPVEYSANQYQEEFTGDSIVTLTLQ